MLLQTTCSSVEENPPTALRLEASTRPRDRGYSVQQDKPRQDCLLSQTNSLQWTSRPSDLKIPERHRSGGLPAGAQPGETYRQSVQQISSSDWRYPGVPGQLQHLNTHLLLLQTVAEAWSVDHLEMINISFALLLVCPPSLTVTYWP